MATKTSFEQDIDIAEMLSNNINLNFEMDYSWLLEWIEENIEPDEIYSRRVLGEWADANGYVLKEDEP